MAKRAIIVVLDSVGIGELPDASNYGDQGSATLQHIYSAMNGFSLPNLEKLGLGISAMRHRFPERTTYRCIWKMAEQSPGKDTTTGHWEMTELFKKKKAFRHFSQDSVTTSCKNSKKKPVMIIYAIVRSAAPK
jgi:phosphopentomutase